MWTTNPTVFAKAIIASSSYDAQLARAVEAGIGDPCPAAQANGA